VAGASLLTDYLGMAQEAGLSELSIPQITPGGQLLVAYGLESKPASSCCGGSAPSDRKWVKEAADSIVSVKVQGKRP
jgi:hypothetical protein